jgi:tRNA pseudouridine55 synthase
MSSLVRSQVHGYKMEDSLKLSEIENLMASGGLSDYIMPIDALLKEYPLMNIKPEGEKYLLNGNKLSPVLFEETVKLPREGQLIRVYNRGECVALYSYNADDKIYKPYKMFLG